MTSNGADNTSAVTPGSGTISLVEIANAILRNWRAVVALPLLLAIVVAAFMLTRERRYVTVGSFMPQTTDNRGLTGAAALAQQFGLNLGTERTGQTPQFYVDLLRSQTILRRAVESEYSVHDDDLQWSGSLVSYWEDDRKRGNQLPWRYAVEKLRDDLSTSVGRETGVVQVTVSADHPQLAEAVATTLLALLNDYNMELRQHRAREEERFIQGRLADAQAELLSAETGLEAFLGRNRAFRNSPELLFEHDRLQRQVLMHQEVYATLLRGMEQARLDGLRDTPLLTIIDEPAGSAEPESRGILLAAVIAFLLGLMIATFLAALREASRRSRQNGDPHFREFEHLARVALTDLRSPRRWLAGGKGAPAAPRD
jgi:uncharacterized protein involved in exopolysaccharide biosynthesis